ncbi:hypothetical protein FEM48_Zijuj09G0029000 [Ziziphus jujuba var. spinosa]|uniref:Uncharacterized protein n=1 Tax=Ziziphus jujuba var. spinosa TaxID=714518 RepID=A0A978UQH4_ZIZJJ|nr:hypothetical protein FEM48_Zijuj09G0029000 [Ziziphus jujuba var. spinosa]
MPKFAATASQPNRGSYRQLLNSSVTLNGFRGSSEAGLRAALDGYVDYAFAEFGGVQPPVYPGLFTVWGSLATSKSFIARMAHLAPHQLAFVFGILGISSTKLIIS